jgi:hypothetical protein
MMNSGGVSTHTFYTSGHSKLARIIFAYLPNLFGDTLVAYEEFAMETGDLVTATAVCGIEAFSRWATRELTPDELAKMGIRHTEPSYHYHKCEKCGSIWSHDPLANAFGDYNQEHICKCGTEQRMMYHPTRSEREKADNSYETRLHSHQTQGDSKWR